MIDLIERWDEFRDQVAGLQSRSPDLKLSEVRLRAPIPRPGKIMAIGLNYKDHIEEADSETPVFQTWFAKAPTSVTGPFDPIALPTVSDRLDYEAELVAIIGRRVRGVSGDQAKAAIFGFCVGDDVSVRDWQIRVSQWVVGKSFDTHAPFGPWITTADETDGRNLAIRCLVNGEVRQSSSTGQLLFDCYAQVEHLSQAMTLEPGDVLYTGTPGGVGHARKPQVFLKAGDVVRVEIEKLGAIENRVAAEPPTGFPG
ncbi:MAG: fumarylacetoacetate hydrolase family protein [Phenylobacterium sp.]